MSYPYEHFNSIDEYYQPIDQLNTEQFNNLLNETDMDVDKRTIEIIKLYNLKNGKEYLLVDVFEKFIKISKQKQKNNPLYLVSLLGFTWQCGLENTGSIKQNIKIKIYC